MARIGNDLSTQTQVLAQAHRPRMAAATVALSQAVYQETTLTFREAEAARIRIAHINGCHLCKNFQVAEGLPGLLRRMNSTEEANTARRGPAPTPEFYAAVPDWRQSDLFSPRERLAIEFAEKVSLEPNDVAYDEAFWARLLAQFDEGEIVDLTYSVTTWIATGRFVHVLGLDGVCPTAPAALTENAA